RSRSGIVKDKLLRDTQLISLICALLLIDGLIVTLWVMVDPIQRHLRNLTLEISPADRSVVYQPQVEVCRSQYTPGWLGALYVYKGLLLVVGVYMAWETRHVKIPALNDSQYIGMSVFVTDDRRELQYRVEVQNRVYRREVAALDAELGRLRRQLAESPPSSGSAASVARRVKLNKAYNKTGSSYDIIHIKNCSATRIYELKNSQFHDIDITEKDSMN
ncbi:Uncharacterized protein GBIM_02197, partial [Gryllus bimaculatus]